MLELIDSLDRIAVLLIHNDLDSKWLDWIMPIVRNPLASLPLYFLVLALVMRNAKEHYVSFMILSIVLIALTDLGSASLFKPWFARLRPLHDPFLKQYLRYLVEPGGEYSFPSSHAANHFGISFLWYRLLKDWTSRNHYWLFAWASLICYAQVYVGKHYPTDIFIGMLYGAFVALVIYGFYKRFVFVQVPKSDSENVSTASSIAIENNSNV